MTVATRITFLIVLLTVLGSRAGAEEVPDLTEPPPYGDFLVIPLRVHVLSSKELPEVDCALTDADLARILGKVNGIWHKAGIHWGLESIVREPAAREDQFRKARDRDSRRDLNNFRLLVPDESRKFAGLHVYYIHKFSVNGVWLGDGVAFVQETASLKPVEGGSDEPIPRVTAHELGHALGLPHRQNRTNLLASGTTGMLLNADEAKVVHAKGEKIPGALTVAALKKAAAEAESAPDLDKARHLWTWLAEVPGDEAGEARKHLEALESVGGRSGS